MIEAIERSDFIAESAILSPAGERLSVFFRDNRKRTYKIITEIDRELKDYQVEGALKRLGEVQVIRLKMEPLSQP